MRGTFSLADNPNVGGPSRLHRTGIYAVLSFTVVRRTREMGASVIKYTEFPGSESDLTPQGIAMIMGYGIVMAGVCMLGCVVPIRRALKIEPTIALRTE